MYNLFKSASLIGIVSAAVLALTVSLPAFGQPQNESLGMSLGTPQTFTATNPIHSRILKKCQMHSQGASTFGADEKCEGKTCSWVDRKNNVKYELNCPAKNEQPKDVRIIECWLGSLNCNK